VVRVRPDGGWRWLMETQSVTADQPFDRYCQELFPSNSREISCSDAVGLLRAPAAIREDLSAPDGLCTRSTNVRNES
jgi:hypothetical protein